jgi:phosphoglucosamine mutase
MHQSGSLLKDELILTVLCQVYRIVHIGTSSIIPQVYAREMIMTKWFGTDGIRGTVGEWPMTPEFMLQLGKAAGYIFQKANRRSTVVIGRDTRWSGPMLQGALQAGLLASGIQVVDLGIAPTPAVAWIAQEMQAEAGCVVSASHNPVDQNGVKFFDESGFKLTEKVETDIEDIITGFLDKPFNSSTGSTAGSIISGSELLELYIRDLLASHPGLDLKDIKLVVDCANGAASEFAPKVFSRLGAEVVAINSVPDGKNINAAAGSEHVRRSLEDMSGLIRTHKANFGVAFDGDADRVVFVDETGRLVDGDHMLGILGRYFDRRGELLGRTVVTTVMRNSGLKRKLETEGIQLIETPVGDKYVSDKIIELSEMQPKVGSSIGLGGEQAGHILIVDEGHPTGDGIRTALFVMRALLESGGTSLAEFAEDVGKTPQIIASAPVGDNIRFSRAELDAKEKELLRIPGMIRANIRYSGTEPLIRVMLESDETLSINDLAKPAMEVCRSAQKISGSAERPVDILNVTSGGVIHLD